MFARYKRDVKRTGKPFYPYAMFHDTLMSFVVVLVIILLAVIWKYTVPGDHTGTEAGWLGPLYTSPADPGTVSFVPRPDWYFYFLFYLLRIFKWPESVILGTVGIPTLCLILLIGLPFYDTRLERRPLRRPVAMVALILVAISMGVLTYKGAAAKEALASEVVGAVPAWVEKNNLPPEAVPGREALRRVRLHQLPYLPRGRLLEPRRARPQRHREQEPRRGLPDRPPQMPVVRGSRLTDAVLRIARRRRAQAARDLPRGLEGATMRATCTSSSG